jgi:hypothetical protein
MAYLIFNRERDTNIEFIENQISTLLLLSKSQINSHSAMDLMDDFNIITADDLSLLVYVLHAEINSYRFILIEIDTDLSTDLYLDLLGKDYKGYLPETPDKNELIKRAQIIKEIDDAGSNISHEEMESLGIKDKVINSINDDDYFSNLDDETKHLLKDFLEKKRMQALANAKKLKRLIQKNF